MPLIVICAVNSEGRKSSNRVSKDVGAYEAGVFKGLYDRLYKDGEPLFDVIAGTSIGAINAAILAS